MRRGPGVSCSKQGQQQNKSCFTQVFILGWRWHDPSWAACAPSWLPTLCGIAGLVGGKEPVICNSLIRHEEDGHDVP